MSASHTYQKLQEKIFNSMYSEIWEKLSLAENVRDTFSEIYSFYKEIISDDSEDKLIYQPFTDRFNLSPLNKKLQTGYDKMIRSQKENLVLYEGISEVEIRHLAFAKSLFLVMNNLDLMKDKISGNEYDKKNGHLFIDGIHNPLSIEEKAEEAAAVITKPDINTQSANNESTETIEKSASSEDLAGTYLKIFSQSPSAILHEEDAIDEELVLQLFGENRY